MQSYSYFSETETSVFFFIKETNKQQALFFGSNFQDTTCEVIEHLSSGFQLSALLLSLHMGEILDAFYIAVFGKTAPFGKMISCIQKEMPIQAWITNVYPESGLRTKKCSITYIFTKQTQLFSIFDP